MIKNKLNKILSIIISFCILFTSLQLQSFAFNNDNSVIFSKTIATDSNTTPTNALNSVEDFSIPIINNNENAEPILNNENMNYSSVNIENFTVELISGAEKQGNDYVWTPNNSASGHSFVFRVNYAASVIDKISVEGLTMRLPLHILKDKSGAFKDTFEIALPSRDEVINFTESEISNDDGYAYYINGDEIVVYNFKDVNAVNGYFEIAYKTSETTFNYLDYGAPNCASNPFKVDINIVQSNSDTNLADTSNEILINIDTSVNIDSSSCGYPTLHTEWNGSWGSKPADSDDYYYLNWPIITNINKNITQLYDISFSSALESETGDIEVYAYKAYGEDTYHDINDNIKTVYNQTIGGYRIDNVLTRYLKNDFKNETNYQISNNLTVNITPVDGSDELQTLISSRTFNWTKPAFTIPNGHDYNINIYGNENWERLYEVKDNNRNWPYARYDLNEFQNKSITSLDDIPYSIYAIGYPFSSTIKDGGSINNPVDYGYKNIKYEITDDTFFPISNDSTAFSSESYISDEGQIPLSSDDYDITKIIYSIDYQDAERNSDGTVKVYDNENTYGFKYNNKSPTSNDILNLAIKVHGLWIEAANYNLGNKTFNIIDNHILSITSNSIVFSTDVDGFKLNTSNNYYKTEIKVTPYIKIFNTDSVLNWTGTNPLTNGVLAKDAVILKNVATLNVYNNNDSNIIQINKIIGDRIRNSEKLSNISKTISSTYNDVTNKQFVISWSIKMRENILTNNNDNSQYIPQDSGTFYDLLPKGSNLEPDSIIVKLNGTQNLNQALFTTTLTNNYKNSGRTLLTIKINTPANFYTVRYNTIHSWNSITDFGKDVLNPVAYETGNDNISLGYPDDGGDLKSENKDLLSNLDITSLNKNKFIYSEEKYNITTITAASTGLRKQVKTDYDSNYQTKTIVKQNANYQYNLRFSNTSDIKSKDIILYDSIENYTTPDGKTSSFHGILTSIDLSQLKLIGIEPTVYYSTIALDLSDESNKDLTNSNWNLLTDTTNLSTVRTIAIDSSKGKNGEEFILKEKQSISVTLNMASPSSFSSSDTSLFAYNNVFLTNTVIDAYGDETKLSSNQGYTTLEFVPSGSFTIHKVNKENQSESIPNVTFRLYGISDLGNIIDVSGDTSLLGYIAFKNIEKGTYILQENECDDDWQIDYTEHVVKIAQNENYLVQIDNANIEYANEKAGEVLTITNLKRVHSNVEFIKVDYKNNTPIENTTFKLSGISDYGKETLLYSLTSGNNYKGRVLFKNVEKGTYKLNEIKANDNYILSKDTLIVTVLENGEYTITGNNVEPDNDFKYKITNIAKKTISFIKKSSYNGKPIKDTVFKLTGVSDLNTKVDIATPSTATGLVEFKGIEPGTYVLEEISAAPGYYLDTAKRIVTVTKDGFSIDSIQNNTIYNQKETTEVVTVTKKWVGKTPSEIIYPTIHISTKNPQIHSVKYVDNYAGGSSNVVYYLTKDNINKLEEGAYSKPINTNLGYSFISWYTDEDCTAGNEFILDENTNIPIIPLKEDITVYAKWSLPSVILNKKAFREIPNINQIATLAFSENTPSDDILIDIGGTGDTGDPSVQGYFDPENANTFYIIHKSTDNPILLPTDSSELFKDFSTLSSIDLSKFSSSNVTNMNNMFSMCQSLTSLDVSNFNTKNVEDMNNMFFNCFVLQSLDLSNFNTEKVKNMQYMFYSCANLTSLNTSSFNTSKVENMQYMFAYCTKLPSLNLRNFDTTNVTNMNSMFKVCWKLETIDTSSFITTNVTDMGQMFYDCQSVSSLNLSNFDTGNVTDMKGIFYRCKNLSTLNTSSFNTGRVTIMSEMFSECASLASLNLGNFGTSNVTNMSSMFYNCTSLYLLTLNNFNTRNVTNMMNMFKNDTALTTIVYSPNFVANENLRDTGMFINCPAAHPW